MARNVSGDARVQLRIGTRSCYIPRLRMIELDEEIVDSWTEEEALGVVAHEGAHVRLSFYLEQLPQDLLRDKLQLSAVNWLEDARIDPWVAHHFQGLAEGMARIERRVLQQPPDPELGSPARALRFLYSLRLQARGWPHPQEKDKQVARAVQRCLDPTREALATWSRDWFAPAEVHRRDSGLFCKTMREVVLPQLRSLLQADRAEARRQGARPRRLLEEQLRRFAEGSQEPWKPFWSSWRQGGQQGAGEPARLIRALPRGYAKRVAGFSGLLERFVRRFEQVLRPNDLKHYVSGFDSGRLDRRRAMRFEAGGTHHGLFARRVDPIDVRIRVMLLADMYSSMAGDRFQAMANVALLVLEACDRLGFESGLLLFGIPEEDQVKVFKEPTEPLAGRRSAIDEALLGSPALGSETPLAGALVRAKGVLGPVEDGQDLVIVVTDGQPRSTEEKFFPDPEVVGVSDDSGKAGARTRIVGRNRMWRPQAAELRDAVQAVKTLSVPDRLVIGVGIGDDAPVQACFRNAQAYADHESFADGLPGLLDGLLSELLGGLSDRSA